MFIVTEYAALISTIHPLVIHNSDYIRFSLRIDILGLLLDFDIYVRYLSHIH